MFYKPALVALLATTLVTATLSPRAQTKEACEDDLNTCTADSGINKSDCTNRYEACIRSILPVNPVNPANLPQASPKASCEVANNACRGDPKNLQSQCESTFRDCKDACQATLDKCQAQPNASNPNCAAQFAACLGKNPYEHPAAPAAPAATPAGPVLGEQPNATSPSKDSCEVANNACRGDPKNLQSQCESTFRDCKDACQATLDKCQAQPNASNPNCAAQFAACLGKNPYEHNSTPPKGLAAKPTSSGPIQVEANDAVSKKPVVGLMAVVLGAVALL